MRAATQALIDAFFTERKELGALRARAGTLVARLAALTPPNKLMVLGNGGSCADSGHIVGELMKEFRLRRPVEAAFCQACRDNGARGFETRLQGAIPAISLTAETPLMTAIVNDIGIDTLYAQQVYGLGAPGDVLIGISTSGNSLPVYNAMVCARAKGVFTAALTGETGGRLAGVADVLLNVPAVRTDRVQELHLPLYHLLCAAAECERFAEEA